MNAVFFYRINPKNPHIPKKNEHFEIYLKHCITVVWK